MIEIITPGALASIQDIGRRGYAALGVPRSGAFDRGAAALANRLVGNDTRAAVIETTMGGLRVRIQDAATLALTGAVCAGNLDWGVPVTVARGTVLRLDPPRSGLRSYLAVRGGFTVAAVLGSRSTDLLSGLGPRPLQSGDLLPVGPLAPADVSATAAVLGPTRRTLRVVAGPREDWFTTEATTLLTTMGWTVRGECDRVGIRLDGPRLERSRMSELPSEAMLPGALQVPPDGRPILLGPDCPVTGGYPVIAVVRTADLDAAAQLRPGDQLRFSR